VLDWILTRTQLNVVIFFICWHLPFRDLKIEIYCWSPSGNHKPMGSCHTTLRRHTSYTTHYFFDLEYRSIKTFLNLYSLCLTPFECYRLCKRNTEIFERKVSNLNIWPMFSVFRNRLQLIYFFYEDPQITIKSRMEYQKVTVSCRFLKRAK
jgi:hypothetical protein